MSLHIIHTKASRSGDGMVQLQDDGRDVYRFHYPSAFQTHRFPEDFAAEGDAYVHLYTWDDDVPENVKSSLNKRNDVNLFSIAESQRKEDAA